MWQVTFAYADGVATKTFSDLAEVQVYLSLEFSGMLQDMLQAIVILRV